ncbi:hypothetical protein C8J55DRAFT_560414 [Lentinula edodes]|uniref:Uncharacterized protein n=1 Tax=Lentinula lateritia TaxID=40482 RepID=A0A9W9AEV1_9AGAR|nr:hypothetical protein C8J55DRAFT_560414 [Lentinula edodes]
MSSIDNLCTELGGILLGLAEGCFSVFQLQQRRAISDADGEGYLYAYIDSNEVKMGMTKNFNRRKEEWDKNCPHAGRIWFPPVRVDNRQRAAHLLLEMDSVVMRSDIPTLPTYRRSDVLTSVTSGRSDVPTSGTHNLCEVALKTLTISMRRLWV